MKIIATIDRNTFLVEATEDELARCAGYSYKTAMPENLRPQVGGEVNVTSAYETTTSLLGASKELSEAKSKLARVVACIDFCQEALTQPSAAIKARMPAR